MPIVIYICIKSHDYSFTGVDIIILHSARAVIILLYLPNYLLRLLSYQQYAITIIITREMHYFRFGIILLKRNNKKKIIINKTAADRYIFISFKAYKQTNTYTIVLQFIF